MNNVLIVDEMFLYWSGDSFVFFFENLHQVVFYNVSR